MRRQIKQTMIKNHYYQHNGRHNSRKIKRASLRDISTNTGSASQITPNHNLIADPPPTSEARAPSPATRFGCNRHVQEQANGRKKLAIDLALWVRLKRRHKPYSVLPNHRKIGGLVMLMDPGVSGTQREMSADRSWEEEESFRALPSTSGRFAWCDGEPRVFFLDLVVLLDFFFWNYYATNMP